MKYFSTFLSFLFVAIFCQTTTSAMSKSNLTAVLAQLQSNHSLDKKALDAALLEAAKKGDVTLCKRILNNPSINNEETNNVFVRAAQNNHIEIFRLFIDDKENLAQRLDFIGLADALEAATECKHTDIIQLLCPFALHAVQPILSNNKKISAANSLDEIDYPDWYEALVLFNALAEANYKPAYAPALQATIQKLNDATCLEIVARADEVLETLIQAGFKEAEEAKKQPAIAAIIAILD